MASVAEELGDEQISIVRDLCRRYHVVQLSLFGSAAKGTFDPTHSDFDFSVTFGEDPNSGPADKYFGFKEALESLLNRSVDLVVSGAVRNRFFEQELDATSIEIYAA